MKPRARPIEEWLQEQREYLRGCISVSSKSDRDHQGPPVVYFLDPNHIRLKLLYDTRSVE